MNKLKSKIPSNALYSIFFFLLLLTLITLFIFPIYPDEIETRFWLSRFFYDFPIRNNGTPSCGANPLLPVVMYLPSIVNWFFHGWVGNIVMLRVVGFIIFFVWIGFLISYVNKKIKINYFSDCNVPSSFDRKLASAVLVASLFFVGVVPVFLIVNRSEQLMVLGIVILIILYVRFDKTTDLSEMRYKKSTLFGYFITSTIILFSHAKGLFFFPLLLIVGLKLFLSFKSRLVSLALFILLIYIGLQDFMMWKAAFVCDGNQKLEALFKSFSFNPFLFISDPSYFFVQAYESIYRFPVYLKQISFQEITDISYLPNVKLDGWDDFANQLIKHNTIFIGFYLFLMVPYSYIKVDLTKKYFFTVNLLLTSILFSLFISAVFNLSKNWYDAAFIYTVLIITLIVHLAENSKSKIQKSFARKLFVYLICVSCLSQVIFIKRNYFAFESGYAGPGNSIVSYVKNNPNKDILAASRLCKIDADKSNNLIVDDLTYFFYRKTNLPMPLTYIMLLNDESSIKKFLMNSQSDGMIVSCNTMPSYFMNTVIKSGGICCVSKKDLLLPN